MKVDSPSFFKDDEDESITLDEYHDSGEAGVYMALLLAVGLKTTFAFRIARVN